MDKFEHYLAEIDRDTLVAAMHDYFEARRNGCHEDMEQHLAVAEACISELNEIAVPVVSAKDLKDIRAETLEAIEEDLDNDIDKDDIDLAGLSPEPKHCS
ncbi:MAG: hypothetical protein LKF74_06040 [Megasphaera sp.]|jgi:hypothetical protein|nr:hypothetical protein [Megasphaera sp.]MCH4188221.1 hypothetical protein [Megasphaera sp.]MCH4218100.1 hypothetical protein [Megasphaera sp.]